MNTGDICNAAYCCLQGQLCGLCLWFMPVVLIETENENDSANQNDVAKIMLQKRRCKNGIAKMTYHHDVADSVVLCASV